MQFDLAMRGPLRAHVEDGGRIVAFRDAAGIRVLTYTGLKLWDADGKAFHTRFVPTTASDAGALCLQIEELRAPYPITVECSLARRRKA